MRAILETVEADGGERVRNLVARGLAHAAEETGRAPQPGADEIEHRDRKAAVDIGGLRQIGDIPGVEAAGHDRARQRLEDADEPRNSVDLPAPFGPITASSAPEATSPLR